MKRHPSVKVKCASCGVIFSKHVCHMRPGRRVFCSIKCYRKGALVVKKCLQCGGGMRIRASVAARGSGKFCSQKCYSLFQRVDKAGPRSHRWRGGKTASRKLIRNSAAYGSWRERVFMRDHFTCVLCGAKGYLHAHHIRPFSVIGGSVRRLYSISNGVTLCRSCHSSAHGRPLVA